MKNKLLLLSFMFLSTFCIAQSTMSIKKVPFSGSAIFLNGSKISLNDAKEIAKNNQEIVNKINYAQTNRTFGAIIGFPGGFAFGYTLGTSFSGNKTIKPNWAIGGIGAAMMAVGTIMQLKGDKQLKEAVDEYNSNIVKTTSLFNPEFYIVSTENGIGFTMRF